MSEKAFSPSRVDVTALAKSGTAVDGQIEASLLPRLMESVTAMSGEVSWSAIGSWKSSVGQDPEVRLHLQIHAQVVLTCQRCLEALQETLALDPVLRFVSNAQLAEQLDEASEDEDVLELPRRLNLVELIEDELIMALPIVPRHDTCPVMPSMVYADPADTPLDPEAPQPHPFAALSALRGGKPKD